MVCGMNNPETIELQSSHTLMERLGAFFEILLLSGLISSFIAALPFALLVGGSLNIISDARIMAGFLMSDASMTFLFLLILLKVRRETPQDMGLRFSANWVGDSMVGIAVVPLLFLFSFVISTVFQTFFPNYFLERNPLTDVIRTHGDLVLMISAGLIAGGIKEELQRAFILTRFERHLGGAKLGLVLWSIAFGAGHYLQGAQGMVAATVFGFIFGTVYLSRRNLIAPMVAHGTYNTLAVLGYWFSRNLTT
jgi:membrane protease YdiL (CAAX protease family)